MTTDDDVAAPPPPSSSSSYSWESFLESVVKVSLATFGGGIVGLAHQQRVQQFEAEMAAAAAASSASADATSSASSGGRPHRNNRIPLRRAPPKKVFAVSRGSPGTSISGKWAISCLSFAMILESSRAASPTSLIINQVEKQQQQQQSEGREDTESENRILHIPKATVTDSNRTTWQRIAITSIGDYVFGGAVAGLSGSLALAKNFSNNNAIGMPGVPISLNQFSRPRLIIWGLGAGMTLGLFAGLIQAGVDVGNMYIEMEQKNAATCDEETISEE